ncbi:MAG: hypothetical protein AUJ20_02135 [Comamonadaceae bacterium CG1_02_60_18]|nr:MAG: hypothetical protein AUJ20_02135 [Comamonadaceae bacterium CG1_02_60_18]
MATLNARFARAFFYLWCVPGLAAPSTTWVLGATVAQESVGFNLPVLALSQPDWSNYLSQADNPGRAFQNQQIEIYAQHPSGWRVAAVVRSQTWLDANADAVTLAAAQASNTNPPEQRHYQLAALSQGWAGRGLRLGTPWWPVATSRRWQWQAGLALLQLTQLRLAQVGGQLDYTAANAYDFDLWSQRSNTGITGRFLPASGSAGSGASMSLAVQGQPLPGWQVALRVDDLASTLQWNNLATDANALVSANTSRRPDGYLDYAPYLKGQKTLQAVTAHIDPRWQLNVQRTLNADASNHAALTLQMSRQAGINQAWLGWQSGPTGGQAPHWSLTLEPHWRALKLQAGWHGWQLVLASDGKGPDTQYRRVELGWQSGF